MRIAMLLTALLSCLSGCWLSHERGGSGEAGSDGGSDDGEREVWPDCLSAAGHHMEQCDLSWEGTECVAPLDGETHHVSSCIAGRVLSVDLSWAPSGTDGCPGPYSIPGQTAAILSASGGCADLLLCRSTGAITVHTCQVDPLPGVRADAAGMTPWTDCATALQSGLDGDRCAGELACFGERSLDSGSESSSLFVFCDAGVLRMMPATSILRSPL